MGNFLEIAFGALGGGVGIKIIDYIFALKRYSADVKKIEIENEGSRSRQWQELYLELKKVQLEQARQIEKMEEEYEELRLKYINLQQQVNFNQA